MATGLSRELYFETLQVKQHVVGRDRNDRIVWPIFGRNIQMRFQPLWYFVA